MIEFQISTIAPHVEELSEQLFLLGAGAITCKDSGNQPIYEPDPDAVIQWDKTLIIALFEDTTLETEISQFLKVCEQSMLIHHFQLQHVKPQDWVRLNLEEF